MSVNMFSMFINMFVNMVVKKVRTLIMIYFLLIMNFSVEISMFKIMFSNMFMNIFDLKKLQIFFARLIRPLTPFHGPECHSQTFLTKKGGKRINLNSFLHSVTPPYIS